MTKAITGLVCLAGFAAVALAGEPAVLHPEGVYTEAATAMKYPATVAKFQRTEVDVAPDGRVHAVYNLATPGQEVIAVVTILDTPRLEFVGGPTPQNILNALRKGLCMQKVDDTLKHEAPDSIGVEDGPAKLSHGWSGYDGYKVGYTMTRASFAGRSQVPVRADVYRFCSIKDIWTIEFRFDYPQGVDASKDIKAFMRELDVTVRDARPEDNACKPTIISRCDG